MSQLLKFKNEADENDTQAGKSKYETQEQMTIRIKNTLRDFEKKVLSQDYNWSIMYYWMKILGDLILQDSMLIDGTFLEKVQQNLNFEDKITLE